METIDTSSDTTTEGVGSLRPGSERAPRRIWIAGGTGYIGSAAVRAARDAGLAPVVLTRSNERAAALRARGIDAVVGDLEAPGDWARELRCELAVFVASPPTWGKRVSAAVAGRFRDGMVRLTQGFFDALAEQPLERAVYVAGTSFYGDSGDGEPGTEELEATPLGWGPYLAPAVEAAQERARRGVPVVFSFPGQVYGPASWNEQLFLAPIAAGKAVTSLRGCDPIFSPIHVDDCGRALIHLLSHGVSGERYLLVGRDRVTAGEWAKGIAAELDRPLRTRSVPAWLCRLLLGPVLTEYATGHTNFVNDKLLATGFSFEHPTWREGVRDVVADWQRTRTSLRTG